LTARPDRTGIEVDFDGTLAEIVPDPALAKPLPGATDVLFGLAASFAVTAIVSGRPVGFLVDRLGLGLSSTPLEIFGEYGIEHRNNDGSVSLDPQATRYLDSVASALEQARAAAPPGVVVEEKGISLTLNWRAVPQLAEAAQALAQRLAERHGLAIRTGKMANELVPKVARDKGSVVTALFAGLSAGCVVGDDTGDIPAFKAVTALADDGGFDAVRVVASSPEVPAELVEAADVVVDGPKGALEFLKELSRRARPR